MYDTLREETRGFLIGLLVTCTVMLILVVFSVIGNSSSTATMADIYRNMPEQDRLVFLKSYFQNKTNSGYYMLVSQEAAFYQILSENGMDEDAIKAVVQATSIKPKVLVKAWENAEDKLKEIDSGVLKYYRENQDSPEDIVVVIDKTYLDVLTDGDATEKVEL